MWATAPLQDFMLDPLVSHTPVKKSKMENMAATRFKTPAYCADISIAMSKGGDPLKMKGSLRRLSPAEPSHAMIMAIRRDVDGGDERTILEWKRICLSTTMIFTEFENNDAFHFAHVQLRENPGIDFELVRHTALQRVLDLAQFHARTLVEKSVRLTPKSLAQTYSGKLELAEANEKITESLCDMALTVYNRLILKAPGVFQILLELDETHGMDNPLDKVSKLQMLVQKANTKEKLEFMVPLMIDLFKSGALNADAFSIRSMRGITNNKGMCDVLMMKQSIIEFLHRWCAESKFDGNVLDTFRKVTTSLATFRTHCGSSNKKNSKPSLTWKAGWQPSAELMLNVFETVVFNTDYDEVMLEHLRANKTKASDMFETPPLNELLEEITEALKSEADTSNGAEDKDQSEQPENDDAVADETPDAFQARAENQGFVASLYQASARYPHVNVTTTV